MAEILPPDTTRSLASHATPRDTATRRPSRRGTWLLIALFVSLALWALIAVAIVQLAAP